MRSEARIELLANDLLEGRGPGTRGHEIAGAYIAAQLRAMNLQPGGDHGSYFQRVPVKTVKAEPASSIALVSAARQQQLVFAKDFLLGGSPSSPEMVVRAPLVFVG